MRPVSFVTLAAAIALTVSVPASAQHTHPTLHVSTRWKECSFQLDPALTKSAWQQFTREAGLVVYFKPLIDARPLGKGHFEFSVTHWTTGIDDHDAAWNDTFVHPSADHWLFEGSGLPFPGLTARAGLSGSTDVGIFLTKNPNANYGVWAMQVQQNILRDDERGMFLSARGSYSTLYGPEDVGVNVAGIDVIGSKALSLTRRISLSPYAGVSGYLTRSQERSAVVNLANESAFGVQAMAGASLQGYGVRLGLEYNVAEVNSVSMKIGFGR